MTNRFIFYKEVDVDTAIDNIEVDPFTGDLWIGCHPLMWTRMDAYKLFSVTCPSQVSRDVQ